MQSIFHRLNSFFKRATASASAPQPEEMEIDAAIFNDYSFIIGSVFTYFNDLSIPAKWKFVKRNKQFLRQKKFNFIGL